MNFLFVKETPISSRSRKNQKNFNNIRVEKPPVDYYAGITFPQVINYPSLSIWYFLFWSHFYLHFIRFHLRLSPFLASAIVLHIVADKIVLSTVKVKVHLWFFSCFSVFQFSSHTVRFSCVLLAWIVNIPFHHIVTVRKSKPTLWVVHINYWIKWKVVNEVSRLRLQWGR